MTYDPNSNDAMFSRMNQRLDTQDDTLKLILAEVKNLRTDMHAKIVPLENRVSSLETDKAVTKGQIVAVSGVVSTVVGFVGWLLTSKS
jgi:hypothetical protein